jgi:type I restriction-modification system DNA methylase subunit
MLLADTIRQVGPAPADLPRITIYDPCCGVGVVLAEAASRLPRHTPDG